MSAIRLIVSVLALLVAPSAAAQLGLAIHDVQGSAHRSPLAGRDVTVMGIVTSVSGAVVTLQSVPGSEDSNPATSEGIFARLDGGGTVALGDLIEVTGWVKELNPGGVESNLTETYVLVSDAPRVMPARALPRPVVLGKGGRFVPRGAIDDDSTGSLEREPGAFDPDNDAIDFFESLEAMRVSVPSPVAVDRSSRYGEVVVLPDGGEGEQLSPPGVLVIGAGSFHPQRIMVKSGRFAHGRFELPQVSAGARFDGDLTGVLTYDHGNPKVLLTEPAPAWTPGPSAPASVPAAPPGALRIVGFNVENLSLKTDAGKFALLGRQIVEQLGSPDVIALQEVQDDSGPDNDGTTSGAGTLARLIEAIDAAGGRSYEAVEIAPENNADGGQPGGNIRVAFLVATDGGAALVRRPGGDATTAVQVEHTDSGRARLSASPGRIKPGHIAWDRSRVPLALELSWGGEPLFVVSCHLNSKGGDDPLFGSWQPPRFGSERQRARQTGVLAEFVAALVQADSDARVVILGDLNDFQFSAPLGLLSGASGLVNMTDTLPPDERWSYIYQGNAQALDHVFVSPGLVSAAGGPAGLQYQLAHLNSWRVDSASDHDPTVLTVLPAGAR